MNANKPELSEEVINNIETLCEQGCTQVNELLEKAESSNNLEELSGFNSRERDQIIDQLSQIMSIYDEDKSQ